MTSETESEWPFSGPISPDWTIDELLQRFSDDALLERARLDERLRLDLARIEAAASAATGASPWIRVPSAVALVRSLDALQRSAPALRAARLGELCAPPLSLGGGALRGAAPDCPALWR